MGVLLFVLQSKKTVPSLCFCLCVDLDLQCVHWVGWKFSTLCCSFFWSGAGHFVLNVHDDGLRTNFGISARELLSFSGIANKPDFSVGLLQAPTAFCEEITPKLFCDVLQSLIVYTCKVSRWVRSVQSRLPVGWPCNGCVLQRFLSRFVFTGRFPVLLSVLLCSLGLSLLR